MDGPTNRLAIWSCVSAVKIAAHDRCPVGLVVKAKPVNWMDEDEDDCGLFSRFSLFLFSSVLG